jgi:hypothetical protein
MTPIITNIEHRIKNEEVKQRKNVVKKCKGQKGKYIII